MKELAHFSQFFAFAFGILALYIGFSVAKEQRRLLRPYLRFLLGINIIIFIHVLEAFFKIVIPSESYDNSYRHFFSYLSLPLAFYRLILGAEYINFSRLWIGKSTKALFYYIASIVFILFFLSILLLSVLGLSPTVETKFDSYLFLTLHGILSLMLIYGSVLIIKNNRKETLNFEFYFSLFIIFYAFSLIILRILNSEIIRISEGAQMFGLGILAILFNLFNVFFIRKLVNILSPEVKNFETKNDSTLYEKFNITSREREVIKLICQGKTNKEIAELLFISPNTARDHTANIFRKVNVNNRTELAMIFHQSFT